MSAPTQSFLPVFLILLISLMACQQPPPFIFVGDERPEAVPDISHRCVNYDLSTNTTDDVLTALAKRSDGAKFYAWVQRIKEIDANHYDYLVEEAQGAISLLLPQNAAVERYEKEHPDLFDDENQFLSLVKHHFLLIKINFNQFAGEGAEPGMNREPVQYKVTDQYCVRFEDMALLISADDVCDRSVIHLIDEVIVPTKGF
ncbi:MAG: fasciclin domain-containing protein [Bacteroidia bacterium]